MWHLRHWSPYRYAVLWTALLPWTYIAYYIPGIHEPWWVLTGEYLLLAGFMAYEWVFRREKLTLTGWILRHGWLRRQAQRSIPPRLKIKLGRISKHLRAGESVLDLGSGHGGLCLALREQGFDVHPVDVVDHSFFPEVKPTIYDGKVLPFGDGAFDTTLLVTVLHHTPDPDAVLREAARVTRGRIIVMEDIYSNLVQKHLTYFTDSLVNLEFEGHPHTNRSDAEWLRTFEGMGKRVVYREDFRTLVFFRQVIYVIE
ncbi:MAG: class I SAM-dependent methyltransferase [Bacteroidia bacterium]